MSEYNSERPFLLLLTRNIPNNKTHKILIMNHEHVTLTFKVYWYFEDYPYLKVTRCKKIINTKNETMLKYGVRGFKIGGKYYKRNEINKMLKLIKLDKFPF